MAQFNPSDQLYEMTIRSRPSPRTTFNEKVTIPGIDCTSASGIEICIYLKNKVGVTLELEKGQIATADELLHLVISEPEVGLSYPESNKIFALWFSSPSLEVQLKPHHLPYKMLQQWPQLLKKFTICDKDAISLEEPILSLQRNVFFPVKEEMKLEDPNVLNLLYEEAKCNILECRYPCEDSDYYTLASLQAGIELGPYNHSEHTLNFFRTKINAFLPKHLCKFRWLFRFNFNAKNSPESQVLEQYCNIPPFTKADQLKRKYLELCWNFPYYGCAFFYGQIEKSGSIITALIGNQDVKVSIAINSEGVYIIDEEENSLFLGLKYEAFSWIFTKAQQPENPDSFPSLYLQFPIVENETKVLKVLQIFSKQAAMMDALISTFAEDLKQEKYWNQTQCNIPRQRSDAVDNGLDSLSDPSLKKSFIHFDSMVSCLSNKLHRLSLATFNEEGDCIN